MQLLRKHIDFVNIFPSCRIPLRTFPVDPTRSSFPGWPLVCINYQLSSLSCVIADTHAQSDARAHLRNACARDSRIYLVISILLSEQCICLRRRKVFDELRTAAGEYNAYWALHILFMHIYAYRMHTRADGRGTERWPPVARGRIYTPARHDRPLRPMVRRRVGVRTLNFFNGGV